MKKMLSIIAVVLVCLISINAASAKSLRDIELNGQVGAQIIVKYGTEGKAHTSLLPTYMNESSIKVENTVQRRNSLGNWQNRVQNRFTVSAINKSYIINFDLGTTADTRAIWINLDAGTRIKGNVYINNGYDYDVNITPKYV